MILLKLDAYAKLAKQPAHGESVINKREILENNFVGGQQRCGHNRECRVFGATDSDLAFEPVATLNS
jgi:hypothetical protein